jgi:cell division protein ZapA
MERRPVDVRIAGQTYRVVSSAEDGDIERLAEGLTERLSRLSSRSRSVGSAQALVLVAMELVHELEEERSARESVERKTRDLLRRVLMRIDGMLDDAPEADNAPRTSADDRLKKSLSC